MTESCCASRLLRGFNAYMLKKIAVVYKLIEVMAIGSRIML